MIVIYTVVDFIVMLFLNNALNFQFLGFTSFEAKQPFTFTSNRVQVFIIILVLSIVLTFLTRLIIFIFRKLLKANAINDIAQIIIPGFAALITFLMLPYYISFKENTAGVNFFMNIVYYTDSNMQKFFYVPLLAFLLFAVSAAIIEIPVLIIKELKRK